MNVSEYITDEITDEDINWVEEIMCVVEFDENRRRIIKNLDSVDVQAFPGSGKTTLLVAKLAILAKKWKSPTAGLCVLSHTNVAREEIEQRLGKSDVGKKLLSYPHFIGTFHSFFDTFVSLPWLQSKGYKINIIESDIVLKHRWVNIKKNIRLFLEYNHKDEKICEYTEEIGHIDWDKKGKIEEEIKRVIDMSHQAGDFTFFEMMLFAKQALVQCDTMPENIQKRFPLLFIDEAQDTDEFQWNLLSMAFGNGIRQGYGDINQAIYSNYMIDNQNGFPRSNPLLLCESKRFDDRIAALANCVAVSREKMIGVKNKYSERSLKHTIFLFNNENICSVISAFGDLVLESFSDNELNESADEGCHAIGMIHKKNEETSINQFPKGIYDYWGEYTCQTNKNKSEFRYLIEYFRNGIAEFKKNKEKKNQIQIISKGLRRIIINFQKENYISNSPNVFASIIKNYPDKAKEIRWYIMELASFSDLIDEETWGIIRNKVNELLKFLNVNYNSELDEYERWIDDHAIETSETNKKCFLPNIYEYTNDESRCVKIEFGSIHSVKGRTHLATLVLETYYRSHNLKSIIKFLCGESSSKLNAIQTKRLKCQYVAMTRARALLCLAIPASSVDSKTRDKLRDVGWNIVEL